MVELESSPAKPRDARTVEAILNAMGVNNYDDRVVNQLLELLYRYVSSVLEDSRVFSEHADKSCIDADDIKLAIRSRVKCTFTQPPSRDVTVRLAAERNAIPLPHVDQKAGLALPPREFQLTAPNYHVVADPNRSFVIKSPKKSPKSPKSPRRSNPYGSGVSSPKRMKPMSKLNSPVVKSPMVKSPVPRASMARSPVVSAAGVRPQGVRSPGIRSPGVKSPIIKSPGRLHGIKSPGVKSPGVKSPGVKSPGLSKSPGLKPRKNVRSPMYSSLPTVKPPVVINLDGPGAEAEHLTASSPAKASLAQRPRYSPSALAKGMLSAVPPPVDVITIDDDGPSTTPAGLLPSSSQGLGQKGNAQNSTR